MNKSIILLVLLAGCAAAPPCATPPAPAAELAAFEEPRPEAIAAKLVHLVTFEMGPVVETLQGYMVLRAPDRLRLYGMTETGQKAFDVSCVGPRIVRIHRAPFLKDDRVLDLIASAAARMFLRRPPKGAAFERDHGGLVHEGEGGRFFYGGPGLHLRWLDGPGFSACFDDWSDEGVYAPRRVLYRSEEGPHPYELRLKLVKGEVLEKLPPDALFEPPA